MHMQVCLCECVRVCVHRCESPEYPAYEDVFAYYHSIIFFSALLDPLFDGPENSPAHEDMCLEHSGLSKHF